MSLNTMVHGLRDGREQAGLDEDLGAFISRLASLLLYFTWTGFYLARFTRAMYLIIAQRGALGLS
jgi:hypothetical protein